MEQNLGHQDEHRQRHQLWRRHRVIGKLRDQLLDRHVAEQSQRRDGYRIEPETNPDAEPEIEGQQNQDGKQNENRVHDQST